MAVLCLRRLLGRLGVLLCAVWCRASAMGVGNEGLGIIETGWLRKWNVGGIVRPSGFRLMITFYENNQWIAHLLATVAWQVEDQHREKRDTHARYYKVDGVK